MDVGEYNNLIAPELMVNIIKEQAVYQYTAMGQGETVLERMLSLIYLGDWVSFWCAVLNDVDPMPIDNIDSQVNPLLAKVRQHIGILLLMDLVEHGCLDAIGS